jgi:hypothetical protein
MGKLTGFIAGAALMVSMGAASAGETPEILGAVDYQAMSKSEMSNITGEFHGPLVNAVNALLVSVGLPPLPALPLPLP